MNQEAINYILTNRKAIIDRCNHFSRYDRQHTEDGVQDTLRKLLIKDYGKIDNIKGFCESSVINYCLNNNRTIKKYLNYDGFFENDEDEIGLLEVLVVNGEDYIQNHNYDPRMEIMLEKLNELPEKQKNAIINRMNKVNVKTNTEKANYRHGFLKLKKSMLEGK